MRVKRGTSLLTVRIDSHEIPILVGCHLPPQLLLVGLYPANMIGIESASLRSTGLTAAQQQDVHRLLNCEKRERKLRNKEEVATFNEVRKAGREEKHHAESVLSVEQKTVMARAFWLYENDRQHKQGSKCINSTEWKRMRALGGASPVLCSYLRRAGWDPAWPAPEPDGRLLRREGQQAALARYSRSTSLR